MATFAVAGTNGNCTIPQNATGIAANVTITNPTAPGFLTLYPSGTARPNASNINWVAGQAPTANSAVIGLAGGTIDVFNYDGTVDLVLDISGYYTGALPGAVAVVAVKPAAGGPSGSASGSPTDAASGSASGSAWGNVTGFMTTPTLAAASSNVTGIYAVTASTDYGAAAQSYCIAFSAPIPANQLLATTVGGFNGANSRWQSSARVLQGRRAGRDDVRPLRGGRSSSQNGSFTFIVP